MTTYQQVEAMARDLGYKSYSDYLKHSEHWKALKKHKKLGADCCVCGCAKRSLLVAHHIRYKSLIDVVPDDLAVMCNICHDDFHMACRKTGANYLDMEIPFIVELVNTFRVSAWYLKRKEKLESKRERRKAAPRLLRPSKTKIQKQFKNYIRGRIDMDSTKRLYEWLLQHIANNTVTTEHGIH